MKNHTPVRTLIVLGLLVTITGCGGGQGGAPQPPTDNGGIDISGQGNNQGTLGAGIIPPASNQTETNNPLPTPVSTTVQPATGSSGTVTNNPAGTGTTAAAGAEDPPPPARGGTSGGGGGPMGASASPIAIPGLPVDKKGRTCVLFSPQGAGPWSLIIQFSGVEGAGPGGVQYTAADIPPQYKQFAGLVGGVPAGGVSPLPGDADLYNLNGRFGFTGVICILDSPEFQLAGVKDTALADVGARVLDWARASYNIKNDDMRLFSESMGTYAGESLGYHKRTRWFSTYAKNDVVGPSDPATGDGPAVVSRDAAYQMRTAVGPGGALSTANALKGREQAAGWNGPANYFIYLGAGYQQHGDPTEFQNMLSVFCRGPVGGPKQYF